MVFLNLYFAPALRPLAAQAAPARTSGLQAHLQQGQAALKAKDIATAATQFRAVLALEPGNAEAHVNLGVIAFTQGDYRGAAEHFRKALATKPSVAQAQALLGICEKRLGNQDAKPLLEGSFAKLKDTELRTQVGMELVGIYYQEGDADQAIPVLQKLVDLNPDNVDILYAAQRLYHELADDTLNKLAVLAPGSARMQQVIAENLINENELSGAIEHYRKALEIDPHVSGVRFELAEAILESAKGNPSVQAQAKQELETAIRIEGDGAKARCELGKIALLMGDVEGARDHYARALALDARDSKAQLGMGRVLILMEQPRDARKYFEMAVHSDPMNAAAHYQLAQAYRRLQMAEQAAKEMHMFQEIEKTRDQVEALYRQMNRQPRVPAEEVEEKDP